MSIISYEGIGQVVATIEMASNVQPGYVVRIPQNDLVFACKDGDEFIGVALTNDGQYGCVQVKGFATVRYTGSVSLGWNTLVGDGNGGVRQADSGVRVFITSVDEENGTAVICL